MRKKILTYEREFIKEDLKSLERLLTYSSAEEMLTEIYSLRKYSSLLIEIINKFYQQYDEFKKRI